VKTDIRLSKEKVQSIDRSRSSKERSLNQLKSNLEALQSTKEGFEAELHQDLLSSLSVTDQKEVDILTDQIRSLTKENKETFTRRMQKEAEKNKLENTLNNNLIRRRDELTQALQEISVEDRKRELDNCKSELKNVESKIKSLEKSVGGAERKLQEAQGKLKQLQENLEKYKLQERECQEKLNEDSKDLEKLATKQNTFQSKVSECVKKIRELGSIPSEAFDKYTNTALKELYRQLEKANQQLKQYAHVNKKALDQFMSFSEQKEKLVARKEELDIGYGKIEELMDHLERRKTEAILFTFRQVTKYFSEVFKKLVPGGHGQLVMQTGARGNELVELLPVINYSFKYHN
jgi:structural maintenance of chromosome 3 (chondroitin sulfate proteoglycan 6)